MEIKKVVNEGHKHGRCSECGKWTVQEALFNQTNDPSKRKENRDEIQKYLDLPILCDKCQGI